MLDASDPEFLLTRPEDMRSALFELTHPDSHILVRDAADREIAVLILGRTSTRASSSGVRATTPARTSNNPTAWACSAAPPSTFTPRPMGRADPLPGAAARRDPFRRRQRGLVSPFPDRLARIQRRKMFRASLITSANRCEATWLPEAQAKPLAFTVRDISVDGVGLRVGLAAPELPQRGEVLEGVQMNFGDLGRLVANLEVRNVYPVSGQPMIAPGADPDEPAPRHVSLTGEPPVSHLGAIFLNLDARQENWLQQVVWRLEKAIGTRSPKRCALPQGRSCGPAKPAPRCPGPGAIC